MPVPDSSHSGTPDFRSIATVAATAGVVGAVVVAGMSWGLGATPGWSVLGACGGFVACAVLAALVVAVTGAKDLEED